MAELTGWSPEKPIVISHATDAIRALAAEYMVYFNVKHVTQHIMECLIEATCPEASTELRRAAKEKIALLKTNAQPEHAVSLILSMVGLSAIHVKDVVVRCAEERARLRIQSARRRTPRVAPMPPKDMTVRMEESETTVVQTTLDLQKSRELLAEYEEQLREVQSELRRVRPDYYAHDKISETLTGQLLAGTKTVDEETSKEESKPVKSTKASKETMKRKDDQKGKQKLVLADASTLAVTGYSPSRAFVLQAARQLFSESRPPIVQSTDTMKREDKDDPTNDAREHTKNYPLCATQGASSIVSLPSNFSLTKDPSMFLPFPYTTNEKLCDALPPTREVISHLAFRALMDDKRPLRVQQEERERMEKEWSPLGKERLACAEMPVGPTAFTRQGGVSELVKLQKNLTNMYLI